MKPKQIKVGDNTMYELECPRCHKKMLAYTEKSVKWNMKIHDVSCESNMKKKEKDEN